MVALVMETILDLRFTRLLYSGSQDTDQSRQHRILYLIDLYLNAPDKGVSARTAFVDQYMPEAEVGTCDRSPVSTTQTRSSVTLYCVLSVRFQQGFSPSTSASSPKVKPGFHIT
jgi:hypothetical protein